jgi:hypothetical protein
MYVQIVAFKLLSHASHEVFLELTKQMISWLRSRNGFAAYELYQGENGWFDRIAWKTEEDARNGQRDFLKTAIAEQMLVLVENNYVSFFGETVATA